LCYTVDRDNEPITRDGKMKAYKKEIEAAYFEVRNNGSGEKIDGVFAPARDTKD
jgi:hypothetical protein